MKINHLCKNTLCDRKTVRLSLGIVCPYLYSGKGFNDSDEVLFQQVVVQLGQVSVDNRVVPQFCSVLC